MTYIAGKAPGAEGKSIRVIRYSDLLTFSEETVATSPRLIRQVRFPSLSLEKHNIRNH